MENINATTNNQGIAEPSQHLTKSQKIGKHLKATHYKLGIDGKLKHNNLILYKK